MYNRRREIEIHNTIQYNTIINQGYFSCLSEQLEQMGITSHKNTKDCLSTIGRLEGKR